MTNVVLAQSSILPKEPENQSSLNNVQTHDGSNTLLATCGRDLFHNHVTLTPDLIFIAWLAAAVVYTCTKFAVDSSSRFTFRAQTHTQSQMQLINLPTSWLPPVKIVTDPWLGWLVVSCYFVCLCIHTLTGKRLELSKPNFIHTQCMTDCLSYGLTSHSTLNTSFLGHSYQLISWLVLWKSKSTPAEKTITIP